VNLAEQKTRLIAQQAWLETCSAKVRPTLQGRPTSVPRARPEICRAGASSRILIASGTTSAHIGAFG